MERGFFHDGITLADVLSDTTYRRLAGRLSAYGHAVTDYQFVKPWLLALILSTLEATDASFEAIHGIEMYFLAQSGEKQIIELEGFSYQIDLFEGFSGEVQEQFLLSAIDPYPGEADSERIAEDLELLHELWISGNWEVFQTFSENLKALTAHIPGYNERFWNERSQNMARRIESFLTEGDGKTYFVIIGAGHLSGERGLVKLLREAGYRVEQITG
ncbi:MAG TPA: TraB/GumN family protein, partial [Atribacteraceae bacterium]|nr:TraB/GumN family protein [Atribacteraceae bacterium]